MESSQIGFCGHGIKGIYSFMLRQSVTLQKLLIFSQSDILSAKGPKEPFGHEIVTCFRETQLLFGILLLSHPISHHLLAAGTFFIMQEYIQFRKTTWESFFWGKICTQ